MVDRGSVFLNLCLIVLPRQRCSQPQVFLQICLTMSCQSTDRQLLKSLRTQRTCGRCRDFLDPKEERKKEEERRKEERRKEKGERRKEGMKEKKRPRSACVVCGAQSTWDRDREITESQCRRCVTAFTMTRRRSRSCPTPCLCR